MSCSFEKSVQAPTSQVRKRGLGRRSSASAGLQQSAGRGSAVSAEASRGRYVTALVMQLVLRHRLEDHEDRGGHEDHVHHRHVHPVLR